MALENHLLIKHGVRAADNKSGLTFYLRSHFEDSVFLSAYLVLFGGIDQRGKEHAVQFSTRGGFNPTVFGAVYLLQDVCHLVVLAKH